MVGSEVVQKLLAYKWDAFAKVGNYLWFSYLFQFALYKRMIVLIAQVFFLSFAAGLRPTEKDRLYFDYVKPEDHVHTGLPQTKGSFGPRYDDYVGP